MNASTTTIVTYLALTTANRRCTVGNDLFNEEPQGIFLQELFEGPANPVQDWSGALNRTKYAYHTPRREHPSSTRALQLPTTFLKWFHLLFEKNTASFNEHDVVKQVLDILEGTGKLIH